jgi:two-component sensor histidine kinase
MEQKLEALVVVFDLIAMLGFSTAFIVVLRGQSRHIDRAARAFLLVCFGLFLLVNLSNVLEHSGVTAYFDTYEDYLEILFIPFFLFFLYSVAVQRELDRSHRAEASLRQSEERILASLKEKEILLKEIHHRVKNNLAIVSSLMNLQAMRSSDAGVCDAFATSRNRIKAMAIIHERLYESDDLSRVSFGGYARQLAESIISSHGLQQSVRLEVKAAETGLGIDTLIPCGLILNELVTNALKHAFEGVESPMLSISLSEEGGELTLSCYDNGRGLPDNVAVKGSGTLGLQIVDMLVKQLGGTIQVSRDAGTKVSVIFQLAPSERLGCFFIAR